MVAATMPMTLGGWLAAGPLAWAGLLARDSAAAAPQPARAPLPAPVRVEFVGALEIVTRVPRGSGGSAEPQRSLRWQGRLLRLDAGTVDLVHVLGHAATADVLVHVVDDHGEGGFHLLHQQGGRLHARHLGATSRGHRGVRTLGPQWGSASRHRPLAGARWLLLDEQLVLDVATRQTHAVPPVPGDLCVWNCTPPLGIAPDGGSLVRFGCVVRGDERVPHLLVADLHARCWQALPLPPRDDHPAAQEVLDPAWLAHHGAWQRDAQGRERLMVRAAAAAVNAATPTRTAPMPAAPRPSTPRPATPLSLQAEPACTA